MSDTPKNLKGTETEKLLATSYVVESTAVTRYSFFANTAQKEKYFQIANVFTETAANEQRHAKIFLQYLAESGCVVTAPIGVDPGVLQPTVDNLRVASSEEENEGVEAYTKAAEVARKEGFDEIADRFLAIASVEMHHKERFDLLRSRIEQGTLWKRDEPIKWQCLVCGYIYEGKEPPAKCPACYHPYQHFEPMEDNF